MKIRNDSTVLLFGMNDNSLDTHTGKLDGKGVMVFSVSSDFTFKINNKTGVEGNGTVRSLLQVEDKLFVGDEKMVRIYKHDKYIK